MNREELKKALIAFIEKGEPHSKADLEEFFEAIELEHRKAMRPLYVSLAEVGIGIIQHAQDTVWVSNSETAIDRVFNELALDMDCREGAPIQQLQNFVNSGGLWLEKLKAMKEDLPVQLELSLQYED